MLIAYRIKQVVIFIKMLAFSVSFVDLQIYYHFFYLSKVYILIDFGAMDVLFNIMCV